MRGVVREGKEMEGEREREKRRGGKGKGGEKERREGREKEGKGRDRRRIGREKWKRKLQHHQPTTITHQYTQAQAPPIFLSLQEHTA